MCRQKCFNVLKNDSVPIHYIFLRCVNSDKHYFRNSFVAYFFLQDAWVTGCLSLASDPESSVQIKLAQCAYELIISPSLSWSKGSVDGDSSSVANGLGWALCCKISSAGKVDRSDVF